MPGWTVVAVITAIEGEWSKKLTSAGHAKRKSCAPAEAHWQGAKLMQVNAPGSEMKPQSWKGA